MDLPIKMTLEFGLMRKTKPQAFTRDGSKNCAIGKLEVRDGDTMLEKNEQM